MRSVPDRSRHGRVVVVGAGIFGAATADALAAAGWSVELVDRHQPGHVRQSSGGVSRLIRFGHGPDAHHSDMAWRARDRWAALEHDSGRTLLLRSGVVWFSASMSGWVEDSEATLRDLGIPVRLLAPAEVGALFPGVETSDLGGALHEPEAGVLRAAEAVRAMVGRAVRRGVTLTLAPARPVAGGAAVEVAGAVREADAVVWACGPWLPALFPTLVDAAVTKQDVLFFGAGPEWSAPAVPGWVDYDAAMYGCGDVDGLGFKAASDLDGERFDPDGGSRLPDAAAIERSRSYLERRFPPLASAPLVGARVCQYTTTPDTRWIVAPHPDHPHVWLVGGGSGHGFKHGPVLGEQVAALVSGERAPERRYALGRRPAAPGLRSETGTAGGAV